MHKYPMFPLSCAAAQLLRSLCAVATKIVIQCTRLFFRAALLKIGGNVASIQTFLFIFSVLLYVWALGLTVRCRG